MRITIYLMSKYVKQSFWTNYLSFVRRPRTNKELHYISQCFLPFTLGDWRVPIVKLAYKLISDPIK